MLAYAAVLALAGLAAAQSVPAVATPEELALVSAQFANSGFNYTDNRGFGLELDAKALLTVAYSFGNVENGAAYTTDQVADAPDVYVTASNETAAWFNSTSRYTLTLADASSLGDPDSQGNYRHFLANSLTGEVPSNGSLSFEPQDGTAITSYAAPGPLEGSGVHRYAWLLFEQPENFQAPSDLSTAGTSPSHWSVQSYVQQTGLQLVAASFFTVAASGDPTGSVVSTQAVNTAMLSVASSTAAASSTHSGSASHSATSGAASPSASTQGSGASSVAVSFAAGLVGLAGVAVAAF